MGNKITIESLMQRAEQRKNDKVKLKTIYNKMLDGDLVLKRIPLSQVADLLDEIDDGNVKLKDCIELYKQLIYKCCPVLQSKELQDEYGCAEPYDIVTEIFDDNVGEINEVAEQILEMYGMSEGKNITDEIEKEIKN